MDLGNLKLSTGTIAPRTTTRKADDNTVAESWLRTAIESGEAKALAGLPGTVSRNEAGKLIYTGTVQEVVNRLRRAAETHNANETDESKHIGVYFDVKQTSKEKATVNFATAAKVRRPRKNKIVEQTIPGTETNE
jgi:hypothetical protein